MANNVRVNYSAISQIYQMSTNSIREMELVQLKMQKSLRDSSLHWKDNKFEELQAIIYECSSQIENAKKELKNTLKALKQILEILDEYDGINFSENLETGLFSRLRGSSSNSNVTSVASTEFGQPHFYDSTREGWNRGVGDLTYDSPIETGRLLNSNQGVPREQGGEGVEGYVGTCGLVSCENVLRMAGLNITEADVVNYARNTRSTNHRNRQLCTTDSHPSNNGGTYITDRQEILQHFGVSSTIEEASIDNIARYVGEGRGVILSVEANRFYGRRSSEQSYHAVTVTSVTVDQVTGQPLGFFVCDSGTGGVDSSRFITAQELRYALVDRMNVTSRIIR